MSIRPTYLHAAFSVLCFFLWAPQASGQTSVESFDGSFQLETGETITGGYFVEDAQGRFLYMDTEQLDKGGLFKRISDLELRSIVPPGVVEVKFIPDQDGKINRLIWHEQGQKPVRGTRIYPHHTRDIQFTSADGTQLHGRLLLPDCAGPHPVIVSVHGSGPVNRYGGPYQTYFLQHGVAVLAYDKRGYTTNENAWHEPDMATLSADVVAAVQFAASQPELDANRIGIFGSSQAGWVVPRAAVEAPQTDFIILRAGAAANQLETVLHEIRQELRNEGMKGLELDYAMSLRREIYTLAMHGKPISATDPVVAPYLGEDWYVAAFGEGMISKRWSADWWDWAQRNLAADPTPYLEKFNGPVLWFLAGLDENVPLVRTRAALERAFANSPSKDHQIVVLDGALHSFLVSSTSSPPHFSDGFFDYMGRWLDAHGFSSMKCWAIE